MNERRREPRVDAHAPVTLHEAEAELVAEMANLSASGVYCTTDQFVAPMSKLQVRFTLSGHARHLIQIRCTGVVVRVEPAITQTHQPRYRLAVAFTNLSERDREAIARFVRERLSASSAPR